MSAHNIPSRDTPRAFHRPLRAIQCVPNFSEGRDGATIAAITSAIAATPGVRLVDFSADPDHHRMVATFVGDPAGVVAAAVAGAAEAVRRIDLTNHAGEHPRLGAVDVIPFVPLGAMPMEECVRAARETGRRLAEDLGLPVYFYEHSALHPERVSLPRIRGAGFEALRELELVDDLAPDLGPPRVHPTAGAVVVGARGPLIAFNVNLQTGSIEVARAVARAIRERDGGLLGVRALGMWLASRDTAQVSVNVTRPEVAGMHQVLEAVRAEAAKHGVAVAGTQLVGTCRVEDILAVARYYLGSEGLKASQIVDLAAMDFLEQQ